VIFLGTAIPSLEIDASLEELKSINHHLLDVLTAIENCRSIDSNCRFSGIAWRPLN
jgi:hypothetical protein